jgi:1-acyl-sn-glycerol-3-phosphate acyltransferase
MRQVLLPFVEALFRVLFEYDCVGEELVPRQGPAIVAANHPSYLDPVLLSLQVRRPIRFMAWDALFHVPVLSAVVRAFGAFPVDTRKGEGRRAYEEAKALVEAGEVVGIFPEGKRSRTAWMEPALREGAARLAWETGAPLIPATITGAFRAWPQFQPLPKPARIRVRFHEPIDPAPFRALPEAEGIAGLLAELRLRVERTLMPGVRSDLRTTALYAKPAPWPRWREGANNPRRRATSRTAAATTVVHRPFLSPIAVWVTFNSSAAKPGGFSFDPVPAVFRPTGVPGLAPAVDPGPLMTATPAGGFRLSSSTVRTLVSSLLKSGS